MINFLFGALLTLAATFPTDGFYQFNIDQDALGGAPDFSFLNHPLSPADHLFVRDGHFYRVGPDLQPNTGDDERVRLFGANLAFGASFPAESDAPRIAKRLRRLGFNIVRLHHMDSSPDSNPNDAGSILTTGPYPTLNPVAVQRLRAFLSALRQEGIYADLNLHVGYQFRPNVDQVPALPEGVQFPEQSKPLHIFYPRMVELQADYTQQLLDSLQLKGDPGLGVVEINNESSILDAWQGSRLDPFLLGDYQTEFQRQWNVFLSASYATTTALRSAWGNTEPDGPELLTGQWQQLEVHPGAQARFLTATNIPEIQVQVDNGSNWVILKQVGFSLSVGQAYLAEVEIKADLPANLTGTAYWDIKQDVSPWMTVAAKDITVTNQWQKLSMAVPSTFAMDHIGRFGLSVEKIVGVPIHVRNCRLHLAGKKGLATGEALETSNISLVKDSEVATDGRMNDYLSFLVDRDRNYLNQIQAAVREKTDSLLPVAGTQMGFGGFLNLDSHQDISYQDNHFYEDHYWFPNTPWDSRDWTIRDSSSVGGGLIQFQNMAATREGGRPYTLSEFNQPWPNTHAAELDPILAAFAAFQDWDGLMHFAYSHGRNWDDGTPDGFNINGDWTKYPNLGQAAWLFRSGAVQTGREMVGIPLPHELRLRAARERRNGWAISFLNNAIGYEPSTALAHPVRLLRDDDSPLVDVAKIQPTSPIVSDTGETSFDTDRKLFLIHTPLAAGIFGFANREIVTSGPIDLELTASSRGFASLLLTSLDGRPVNRSRHLLLSNPGYTLPTQSGSNPASPQPLTNYGSSTDLWTLQSDSGKPSGGLSGGRKPVWMERVENYLTFRTQATTLLVYPLDGKGARLTPLKAQDVVRVDSGFRIHLQAVGQARSPWYEFVAEGVPLSPEEKLINERLAMPERVPKRSR